MVKPTDWDSVEADEAEAIRRHARADFRMNEMKKELQDLKNIVHSNEDKNAAYKKIRKYQKHKKSIFGEIGRIDRSKDYTSEGIRIQYESLYGEVEPSDSSKELRDDREGNEDDVL
jgi:hypothetical protein